MKHLLFWILILSCGISQANEQLQASVDDLTDKVTQLAYAPNSNEEIQAIPHTLMVVYDFSSKPELQRNYPPLQPVYFSDLAGCNTARKATKIALNRAKVLAEIWCTPG